MFLKTVQNSEENTCARVSFFNKVDDLQAATLLNFYLHLFYRTPPDSCLCSLTVEDLLLFTKIDSTTFSNYIRNIQIEDDEILVSSFLI